uniref:Uncharacterized protein n=1 Tax=Methylophaga nitratireducenticrescens TaxID=754476 RepID=I1XJE3_METNJ
MRTVHFMSWLLMKTLKTKNVDWSLLHKGSAIFAEKNTTTF